MEIYEQYYLRTESGFNKGAFLLTALILGNPLTGEWVYAQLVEDELLFDLIGHENTHKLGAFLADVKSNINSRSTSDSSVPAGHLFGNPWLLNLAKEYGDFLNLEEAIHVSGQGSGQAIIHAYTHMQSEMAKLSSHHSQHKHHKGKGKHKY